MVNRTFREKKEKASRISDCDWLRIEWLEIFGGRDVFGSGGKPESNLTGEFDQEHYSTVPTSVNAFF